MLVYGNVRYILVVINADLMAEKVQVGRTDLMKAMAPVT